MKHASPFAAVAIVPARGGSKGIAGKNLRTLAGKPLLAWAIDAALDASGISRVIVSTDSPDIRKVALEWGAEAPFLRPPALAQDSTPTVPVIEHALSFLRSHEHKLPPRFVLLQPTSPLRSAGDVDAALTVLSSSGAESVVSISPIEHPGNWQVRMKHDGVVSFPNPPASQRQAAERGYRLNGAVYAVQTGAFLRKKTLFFPTTRGYVMPAGRSVDIDSETDLLSAESLLAHQAISPLVLTPSHSIGAGHPSFIIAEAGVNHNGDIALAKKLIESSKRAGADAVKFQTFSADSLVTRSAPKAQYQSAATKRSESQYDMLKKLEFSASEWGVLAEHARKTGIIFLSTPFDEGSANLLETLGVPAFKIGSGDLTNDPLLSHVARMRKPMLISTGMSTLAEVSHAVRTIRQAGNHRIVLFHCTSSYPATVGESNVRAVQTLSRSFSVPAGFSDHTEGAVAAAAAVALGACVIEKHLTLDKSLPGPDHRASLNPAEFTEFVRTLHSVESSLGSPVKGVTPSEKEIRIKSRRSLVAADSIKAGTVLSRAHLAIKRPGTGLSPSLLPQFLGKRAKRGLKKDEQIQLSDVK